MKISVALAYYNGGRYIGEQLESILSQLRGNDEVIISVDGCSDGSGEILEEWALRDSRIRILDGPAQGIVKNFENAITYCSGDVIFLSDQDDIWKHNKVRKVLSAFEKSGCTAIVHNGKIMDEQGKETGEKTLFELRGSRPGFLKNLIKNSYIGCCMAFKKELIPVILPIPDKMYMHDYWIGTAAECNGGVGFIKEPLIHYRRHDGNVTEMHHGGFVFMIKKRLDILSCLSLLKKRK